MLETRLGAFITEHREALIRHCDDKVLHRSGPSFAGAAIDHGVPTFLSQLCAELQNGPSPTDEITKSATKNGRDLLLRHFTLSQVVHGYGDVCQSVTELAVELGIHISADDFRTLNRCLDVAIASAVTEFAKEREVTRDGETQELRALIDTASIGFEALQTGAFGFGSNTANVVQRTLAAIRMLADRQRTDYIPLNRI